MNNQCDRVLEYMRKHNDISARDALLHLSVSRLASRIHDLKKAGYAISDAWVYSKNQFGEETRHKVYILKESDGHEDNQGV